MVITRIDALKYQQQKAINKGILRDWCLKQGYSEKFVVEFFCPTCEHGIICQEQAETREKGGKKCLKS